ncbi:homoserine O-succinyltransferase [Oceanobacillus oncorhynchi subsp. incaldanensis]|uniref:Homoserine O-acetyltransferase n=1 Tax=Oceanobacillus oncorhynchi TaxID=545501 RepID=A0A0A1MGW8_9BACI|nr:homoserine O-succinyltransferase [Oceanobacillus oncorhynchi]MDM8100337.1 homoserine O-succinyltransferase [Oceanobacillus oncorhynchi]UUI40850.1 homoserine O-succinyltransferase [Oceanobacillus oncorhynchi]GIO18715.1 homoserine O-succinyltransferase [Oceanobacillus oncorhynchi subsp. incaldanensis]CEI82288.1 Homoserine O-succinyltransferase [Oceanobacillus oncorhynchi]
MPIKIPRELPAKEILEEENIFVMDEQRADAQEIRPLSILILNLMPEKQKTETQLLRYLGNTPLQVRISFLRMASHESKTTNQNHLDTFYKTFEEVRDKTFDGMIITGSPVEHLSFTDVDYWEELQEIMDWTNDHVTSTLHICWGAQAALYHHYGIDKHPLPKKCFGIFEHDVLTPKERLVRGFDEVFLAPHSRYTTVSLEEIENHPELQLIAVSDDAGVFLLASKDGKHIMATGHLEYMANTLKEEYERDHARGIDTAMPENYYPNNDPEKQPKHRWKSHSSLLFSNWLNYYVYQETPYVWGEE